MDTYSNRRIRVLHSMEGGVAILPTGPEVIRNADSHYRFRPDSDFFYLTGFSEPNAILVLAPHSRTLRSVLFLQPKDPEREVWTGRRVGVERAPERFSVDAAFPIAEFESRLPDLLLGAEELYYSLGTWPAIDRSVLTVFNHLRQQKRRLEPSPHRVTDPGRLLHALRVHKSPEELQALRRAVAITCEAHRAAMCATAPGIRESQIEALVEFTFRSRGAVGPAYPTIVGAGENAAILHYIDNASTLQDGQLLLLDAGAEVNYYCADITRTWPVNGRFSAVQKDAYEVVLDAQRAAIHLARPGNSLEDIHLLTVRRLTEGLVFLKVLSGSVDDLVETGAYKPYYMHRTSHYLGLDVHDAGDYVHDRRPRPLEPSMVITVEPGLYFAPDAPSQAAAFRGIGIRIEDDVLVTEKDPEVLTGAVPKDSAEVELLMAQGQDPSGFRVKFPDEYPLRTS